MSDDQYPDVTAALAAFQAVAKRLADAFPAAQMERSKRHHGVTVVTVEVAPFVEISADWVSAGEAIELLAAVPPVSAAAKLDPGQARMVAAALVRAADAMEPPAVPEPVDTVTDTGPRQIAETWFPAPECHCPACGARTVWVGSDDDYYLGMEHVMEHVCVTCAVRFTMPTGPTPCEGTHLQTVEQIRQALASRPLPPPAGRPDDPGRVE